MIINWILAFGKSLAWSHFFLAGPHSYSFHSGLLPISSLTLPCLSLPTCTWRTSFSSFLPSHTINLKQNTWPRTGCLLQCPISLFWCVLVGFGFRPPNPKSTLSRYGANEGTTPLHPNSAESCWMCRMHQLSGARFDWKQLTVPAIW